MDCKKESADVYFWVTVDLKVKKEDEKDLLTLIQPKSISTYLHTDDMDDFSVVRRKDLGNGYMYVEFSGDIMQQIEISNHDLAEIESYDSVSTDVVAEVIFVANQLKARLEQLFREGVVATRDSRVFVSEPDEEELIDEVSDQVYYR